MPRRIITGQRPDATSYVARCEPLQSDHRGIGSHRVWAVDDLPSLGLPFTTAAAPIASAPTAIETPAALLAASPQPQAPGQFRASLQRMAPRADGGGGGLSLHWHDTFDLQWLLAGELTITLDGGDEATLGPGDLVVQHGTNHAWRAGPDGATLAIMMFGGHRVGVAPPAADRLDLSRWAPGALKSGAPAAEWQWCSVDELAARTPRRIVTGQSADGRSRVVADEAVASGAPEGSPVVAHGMWSQDGLLPVQLPFMRTPNAGRWGGAPGLSPHPGRNALRARLARFAPRTAPGAPGAPGAAGVAGSGVDLHWTETIDLVWMLAGHLILGLDDGSHTELSAGDVVVQHGTNHSWHPGADGAVAAFVMLGVDRASLAPPAHARMVRA